MPVAPLSPYVPSPVFSENLSKETRLLQDGIELALRYEMTERERRFLQLHGVSKIVMLADWSAIIDVTDVTLSRYNNGESRPPLGLVQFLRVMFRRIERNPRVGVDALIDYLNRKPGPSIDEVAMAGDVISAPPAPSIESAAENGSKEAALPVSH
mgnify:FL=1|jgi:hypothetical protein